VDVDARRTSAPPKSGAPVTTNGRGAERWVLVLASGDGAPLAWDPPAAGRAHSFLVRWNFSSDFFTRVPRHLAVLPVEDVAWSDWGTREAIERTVATFDRAAPWRAFRALLAHGN
jgi:hypothetical protein